MIGTKGIHLGRSIGNLREAGGMSRKELAEAAGISESHLKKSKRESDSRAYRPMRG